MHIDATTPYNQNFQKRIKINKSNLTKIATTAGLGTTAVASLAAQTDYDLGCIAATNVSANPAQEPSYKGITLPIINGLNDAARDEYNEWKDNSAVLSGATGSFALFPQLVGSAGYKILDKLTGKKLSETSNEISFKLGKEKRHELAISDAASVGAAGLMSLGKNDLNNEDLASLGTMVSAMSLWNSAKIIDAYEKPNSNNKKFPS